MYALPPSRSAYDLPAVWLRGGKRFWISSSRRLGQHLLCLREEVNFAFLISDVYKSAA